MPFVNDDEIQIRIYPQASGYNCKRWEWVIWRGSEDLGRGVLDGSEKDARREAHLALDLLGSRGSLGLR